MDAFTTAKFVGTQRKVRDEPVPNLLLYHQKFVSDSLGIQYAGLAPEDFCCTDTPYIEQCLCILNKSFVDDQIQNTNPLFSSQVVRSSLLPTRQ
jgi:hypothetical protein